MATRSSPVRHGPLPTTTRRLWYWEAPVRLACIRHAASVYPEPGSNSPSVLHVHYPVRQQTIDCRISCITLRQYNSPHPTESPSCLLLNCQRAARSIRLAATQYFECSAIVPREFQSVKDTPKTLPLTPLRTAPTGAFPSRARLECYHEQVGTSSVNGQFVDPH